MSTKINSANFIRFLKDEKFIEWKIFPTDELNTYWEEFIKQYPEERENIALAEKHFEQIKLSSYKILEEEKHDASKRLEQSLRVYVKKRRIQRLVYVATACAVIFILSLLIQKELNLFQNELSSPTDCIVANQLESKDILLISNNTTTSFQEDIDIYVNTNKTAQINTGKDDEKEISIAQDAMNKLIVPHGRRSKIVLADGTQVWLNSGSTLQFPSVFAGSNREIHLLSGEIYIEVAPDKNKSFYVHTSDFNVKVYGTKFNVTSYANSPSSVVLVEGSISLKSTSKQEIFLSPKQQAIYSNEGIFNTQNVNVQSFISWKDGYLIFEDTPVIEVMRQIENYYNLSFIYAKDIVFEELTCTGKIILSDNVDNVMMTLTLISSTNYKKEDKLIFLYNNNLKPYVNMNE